MNHPFRRAARVLSLTALALCLVAPAAAEGRSRPSGGPARVFPVLRISIGTRCLDGVSFVANDSIRLTQRRGITTLTDVTFKISGSSFRRCLSKPVAAGDLIRFVRKVGTKVKNQRTVTVPDLRITGNLETNTLSVDGSMGGVPLTGALGLGADAHIAGLYTHGLGTAAILDGAGHSDVPMSWYSWTLLPGDVTSTSFMTEAGDQIFRWWAPPTMTAQVGKAGVKGTGRPGSTQKLTLKAASGAIRSTATAKVGLGLMAGLDGYESSPWHDTTFRKNGAPVVAKAGNRIVSAAMDPDGRRLRVGDFKATAGKGDATLTGTCNPHSRVAIAHGVNVEWSFETSSGAIARSDLYLTSGERIVIGCQTSDGYGQRFVVTVP